MIDMELPLATMNTFACKLQISDRPVSDGSRWLNAYTFQTQL